MQSRMKLELRVEPSQIRLIYVANAGIFAAKLISLFIVANENPKEAGRMENTVEIFKVRRINGFSDPRGNG